MHKWIPSIIIMASIFYLSSRTSSDLNSMFPFFSSLNWGHLVAYFVLSLTFVWPLRERFTLKTSMVLAVSLSVLYGLTDEWHQMYVPGRYPDWLDILNDFIGATVAMLGYGWWIRRKKD